MQNTSEDNNVRIRLPSSLKSVALGIACDFVLVSPNQLPTACESGKSFPIPDLTPSDTWTAIRERGPLLSTLLELGLEDGPLLSFIEHSRQVLERLNRQPDGAKPAEEEGNTSNASTRGGIEKERRSRSDTEGTNIYFNLSSTTAGGSGELISATFDVPKDSDDSGLRWARVTNIRLAA